MHVARGDAVGLTRLLVRIDSRNPSLVTGGPGESAIAHALADVLSRGGSESRWRKQRPAVRMSWRASARHEAAAR